MDGKIRRSHSSAFKAQVALAAIKEEKTITELAGLYGVHATQITKWKKQALDSLSEIFSNKQERRSQEEHENTEELYRHVKYPVFQDHFLKLVMQTDRVTF